MSDADYLKCECQKCGGSIEFPANGVGELVDCPHCGGQTKLIPSPARSGQKIAFITGAIFIVLILVTAGAMLYWPRTPKPVLPPITAVQTVTNVPVPEEFTELNGFKIGKITLKKAEGSGLVYAVGTVKNDTGQQRFGVRIELDLLDASDAKIGSASDYLEVLQPRKEWQFHALLTEPKTIRAKLANIEEQK